MAHTSCTDTLVMLLAGGQGERLYPLTKKRAKPAVPFGGLYRIVDFTLSNCLNSGLKRIYVLTQHHSLSLDRHLRAAWSILHPELGEFIQTVPPQLQLVSRWYAGTADAVFQNLDYIRGHRPKHVLVLAGDHIYTMDYGPMIAYHVEKHADVTVGVVEVARERAKEFGVLSVTEYNRVVRFTEKPSDPEPMPGRPGTALASMGIYIFNADLLETLLSADAASDDTQHDFGKNIIPGAIDKLAVFAYAFQDVRTRAQAYWRDVGTLDAYYEANMELVYVRPELNIYDEEWPIWTYQMQRPPAKFILDEDGRRGMAINSMVTGGCIVSGALVRETLLFTDVRVEERSVVQSSVVLPKVSVGRNCIVQRAILDEGCVVPDGMKIGVDRAADRLRFEVTEKGVVLVTPDMLRESA